MKLLNYLILTLSIISFGCNNVESIESIEIDFPKQNETIEYFGNKLEWSNNTSNSVRLRLYKDFHPMIDTLLDENTNQLIVSLDPETEYNLEISNSNDFTEVDFNTIKPLEKYINPYQISIDKSLNSSSVQTYVDSLYLSKIDETSYFISIDKLNLESELKFLFSDENESKIVYGSICQSTEEPCTILSLFPDSNTFNLSILNYEDDLEYRYSAIIEI